MITNKQIREVDDILFCLSPEDLQLDALLEHPFPYEQNLVKVILNGRTDTVMSSTDYLEHRFMFNNPIKIEGIETLNTLMWGIRNDLGVALDFKGPITCHAFLSGAGSLSFPMHADPDAVVLYMVDGSKTICFEDGEEVALRRGDALYIEPNRRHQAINTDTSIMLSFGLESLIMKKLSQ